jgi:spore maturation protein CgeB
MKIAMFYHSLVSDWNHGNAHFLRGTASELVRRGHEVTVYEPAGGWSRSMLIQHHGTDPIRSFHAAYPELTTEIYQEDGFDPATAVADADLVIVHEWNDHALVKRIGNLRRRHPFVLLFHDTHHRLVTDPAAMDAYDLSAYDGIWRGAEKPLPLAPPHAPCLDMA